MLTYVDAHTYETKHLNVLDICVIDLLKDISFYQMYKITFYVALFKYILIYRNLLRGDKLGRRAQEAQQGYRTLSVFLQLSE